MPAVLDAVTILLEIRGEVSLDETKEKALLTEKQAYIFHSLFHHTTQYMGKYLFLGQ